MSDDEKLEQIGRLAKEVGHLKGEINHVNEKLSRAFFAYNRMSQSPMTNNWNVSDGQLNIPSQSGQYQPQGAELDGLLNKHQLIEVLEHRQKLASELDEKSQRLKGLAPNLL